ncbi:MAG: hypothetical protein Q4D13_08070 [Erysipelotrichaceae bacterium]|nr:hypothetical protein [Erysipelotrichaceae bacterium]
MDKKKISNILIFIAVLIFGAMCFNVGFDYCDMLWGIRYLCYSAPSYVAFFVAIPYLIVIAIILIAAYILRKKDKNEN